ncbi:MAG TPA: PspC domain-containing protein [Daejeonella sp.]|uniref:PspC domain-containing protein n=1 Tax=Daejeonella sp. TaxID=2805397 RepID=UPI002EDB4F02
MNKTIIININGIVFHIEEDAYEVLRTYMTSVKRHFAYSADSEEIVTDIENRLAEMFSEKLKQDHKQVIIVEDVEYVTEKMGTVDDFNIDEEDPTIRLSTGAFKTEKKLFRDLDDSIISGVCAGIGHYFDVEPKWIRLIAIITLFMGIGIPVYIILWLVIPKARTRVDKMAMKGEPINIQSFKKNFDEEIQNLKSGFKTAHKEAKPAIHQLAKFIGKAGMIFVKIIGAIIILAGITGLFVLGIGLITFLGYWNGNQLNTFPFNMVNPGYKSILTLSAFTLLFIPITALVVFAIRVLFAHFEVSKGVYFGMLIIWLAALGIGVYHVSKIGSEFNEEAQYSIKSNLKPSNTFYLKLNPVQYLTKEDSMDYNIDPNDFKGRIIMNSRRGNFNLPRNVSLKIVKADVSTPILIQEFSAKGPDFETALSNAQSAKHRYIQTDSLLLIDGNTHLQKGELWRDQNVHLVLRIPVSTTVFIEGTLNQYLEDYSLWDCQPQNAKNDFLSEWVMTDNGLKCKNDSLYNQKRNTPEPEEQY